MNILGKIVLIYFFILIFTGTDAQEVKPLGIGLENFAYPYPVRYIELDVQDERLHMAYMDVQPEKANGKTIMLMHGKNFCGAYWEQTAKDLSKAGYRVIIPDQIGFGKSSKPKDLQYSFHLLAQNTKKLLDSLNISETSVLGHSMGGMVASRFVLMYPEMIDKFILENPIGLKDWKVKVPYIGVDQWYRQELNKNYEKIKQYQLENYYDGKWKPEYDRWVNLQAGWTLSPEYRFIAWNAALTYDMIFTQPVVYEFPNIKAPTLLIIGQRDRTALGKNLVSKEVRETLGRYPELGRKTRDAIPNATLVELDDVGHLPHIEAYSRFIDPLLKFMED